MAKAKKVEKVEKEPATYGDFVLYNNEKLDRVINGVMGAQGKLTDGLGKDAPISAILAEYDRIGGLVRTRDGKKVALGSFYDFDKGVARETPLVEIDEKPQTGMKLNEEHVSGPNETAKPSKRRKKEIEEE